MPHFIFLLITVLLITANDANTQNLPSLLTERNINSTFSIVAYDNEAEEWGIAVATNNIYVGNSTIYIEPSVGAFSVIAETNPKYGILGLEKLKAGLSIEQSIKEIKGADRDANYRQVSGIDASGEVFGFTGKSLKYWKGNASQISGNNFIVSGNQLAKGVLQEMSIAFENSKGTLAQRLFNSLNTGQNAGGQISGKQSAAIVVKGAGNEWYNQIDLRVDNSQQPFKELETLINYHYGRIRLNQAKHAFRAGNSKRANQKLLEAETMLDGWTGMYSNMAGTNAAMGHYDKAIKWIKKGLEENPKWTVNLPAFYFLKDHHDMKSLIQPESFTTDDWESAIGMLSNLARELEIIELAKELKKKKVESSYLNFLIGRSHYYEGEIDKATELLELALKMDIDNVEAQNLLKRLRDKK